MVKNINPTNKTKIKTLTIALLMMLYIASLSLAYAGSEQTSNAGQTSNADEIPDIPKNAVQYNKTGITPVCEIEQVQAGETHAFQYRNATILMNCTRNCELNVTIDPTIKPKIFGLSIDPNQTMTLTLNLSGSPLEGAEVMERTLNFYVGIEPNATLQLSAQLRLRINQTELSQELNREVNASRLTWMFWNRTRAQWEAVESYMDQNGYLVCNTDHFSTWTVAEISESTEASPEPEAKTNGVQTAFIYVGIVAVVVGALAVGLYANSKRKK